MSTAISIRISQSILALGRVRVYFPSVGNPKVVCKFITSSTNHLRYSTIPSRRALSSTDIARTMLFAFPCYHNFLRHHLRSLNRCRSRTESVHSRLISGGKNDGTSTTTDEDGDDLDRSKFTHELKIEMPNVGDDITGVIEKWYKKKGDIIKKDEVICDIRTELFTFGMLTDDDYDSIMGEIHVQEGSDPIKSGTVICTTLNEGQGDEGDSDGND